MHPPRIHFGLPLLLGALLSAACLATTTVVAMQPAPALTIDDCDIDIRPFGVVPSTKARHLKVEYKILVENEHGFELTLTPEGLSTYNLYDQDGYRYRDCDKPLTVKITWDDVATLPTANVAVAGGKARKIVTTGAYDATEADYSPFFERQGWTEEYIRIRVRYRGRTTFVAIRQP